MQHYNPTIVENTRRIFNNKTGDSLVSEIHPQILPVIQIKSINNIIRSNSRGTTGATAVYTTPADKNFYLTSLQLTGTCDVACDVTEYWINVVVDGVASVRALSIRKQTLTAGSFTETLIIPDGLRVDKNTAISINQTFTVGTSSVAATVIGYTEEVTS